MPIALLFIALILAGCSSPPDNLLTERLVPCTSDQGPTDGLCGRMEVFENRASGQGRTIDLKIVALPAYGSEPAPDPVFFLAGGPGQGAADVAGFVGNAFDRVRTNRDIVLVDQRGTGDSGRLDCIPYEDDETPPDDFEVPREKIDECLASYGDVDLTQYVTSIAMDDLDQVREWLGYERINLYGGSYGTRAGLVYMRRHEDRVRSVVLDGVAPPDMTLPLYFPRDTQRALDQLVADCASQPACSERFPSFGDDLDRLFEKLDRERPNVTISHPRTGEIRDQTLTRRLLAMTLTGALYSPQLSSLAPLAVERALAADYRALSAMAGSGEGAAESMAQGMFYSVTCSEDYPRLTEEAIEREAANTFLARDALETRWKPCEYWPRAEVPESFYEPVRSQVPVLILSGQLDPVTPPAWGEHIAAGLPNSRHLVAPGVGHGVAANGCAMELIDQFYNEASADGLDPSCLEQIARPPFFVSPAGPYSSDMQAEGGEQ